VLRDPVSWYASAFRHHQTYQQLDQAIDAWLETSRGALSVSDMGPDRMVFISFQSLVRETERTMRGLCEWLGLAFDPVLLKPTFKGVSIEADSSFAESQIAGVRQEAADRSGHLPDAVIKEIRARTDALYATLRQRCL